LKSIHLCGLEETVKIFLDVPGDCEIHLSCADEDSSSEEDSEYNRKVDSAQSSNFKSNLYFDSTTRAWIDFAEDKKGTPKSESKEEMKRKRRKTQLIEINNDSRHMTYNDAPSSSGNNSSSRSGSRSSSSRGRSRGSSSRSSSAL
jgi:hypothetical protein